MQHRITGSLRAASPSALTLNRLTAAINTAAEAARLARACGPVDDAAALALTRLRAALDVKPRTAKVRAAIATAEALRDDADRLAEQTAEALGRQAAAAAATAALCALGRALFADRLRALALGDLWTGSGYCDALAAGAESLGVAGICEARVPALAADGAPLAHVAFSVNPWTGEAESFGVVALTPSRAEGFDAVRITLPEVDAYREPAKRREPEVGMTSTRLPLADAPALAEAYNVAAAVAEVVKRYVAAHPERNPREEAEAAVAEALAAMAALTPSA